MPRCDQGGRKHDGRAIHCALAMANAGRRVYNFTWPEAVDRFRYRRTGAVFREAISTAFR